MKNENAIMDRIKARIAYHANEHRHTYEIGKGVMDFLARDLLADFKAAGGLLPPVALDGKNISFQDILESGYTNRDKSLCLLESENRLCISSADLYRRNKTKSQGNIVFFSRDFDPEKGVRMLSQYEVERLQTLPNGYTRAVNRNIAAGLCGNGWTVDVIAHILSAIPEEGETK